LDPKGYAAEIHALWEKVIQKISKVVKQKLPKPKLLK
jgi:hypothetical protein